MMTIEHSCATTLLLAYSFFCSTGSEPARFAYSIAGYDDVDADGIHDILVGVPGADSGRGVVVVLSASDGSVLRQLHAQESRGLGRYVASIGDIDGDGLEDIAASDYTGQLHVWYGGSGELAFRTEGLVAAPLPPPGPEDSGAFAVLVGSPNDQNGVQWINGDQKTEVRFLAGDGQLLGKIVPQEGSRFYGLSMCGPDPDRDDLEPKLCVIGVERPDSGTPVGRLWLYSIDSEWNSRVLDHARVPAAWCVPSGGSAICTNDLSEMGIVARFAKPGGDGVAGKAFAIEENLLRSGHEVPCQRPSVSHMHAMSSIGDVDEDGHPDWAVGEHPLDGMSAGGSGTVSVYSGKTFRKLYEINGPQWFGRSVLGIDDVSGDGIPDLAVSTSHFYLGQFWHRGMLSVFSGSDGTLLYEVAWPVERK